MTVEESGGEALFWLAAIKHFSPLGQRGELSLAGRVTLARLQKDSFRYPLDQLISWASSTG